MLFSSHALVPQNKSPRRETTEELFGGRALIREPRTEKQSTGLFFPACGRVVLFSSHSLVPQNKSPRRETTEELFGGRALIREPRTEKQSTGLFFPACGRVVLFSSHSLVPQNKSPRRETTEELFGGREWIRTTEVVDGRFTVCSLWPLGNSPIFSLLRHQSIILRCSYQSPFGLCIRGGAGGRTRTPDLLITNQLLYQLSYTSIFNARIS